MADDRLRRVAEATGTKLKISFVPDDRISNPSADVSTAKNQHKGLSD